MFFILGRSFIMGIVFTSELKKIASQGEKTGWTYITVPQNIGEKIKPGTKRSYKVKGFIDRHPINKMAMIPLGGGDFIVALNASIRKAINKEKGAKVKVSLEVDVSEYILCPGLMVCLQDDPEALSFFDSLSPSYQRYFSKWIETAKLDPTRISRIAMTVNAMSDKMGFAEMIRMKK